MSRSSTDSAAKQIVYVLIEIENGEVYSRVFKSLHKAVVKAQSWTDSYYMATEYQVPSHLPTVDDVYKQIGPDSKKRSFYFHTCKGFELIIRRSSLQ